MDRRGRPAAPGSRAALRRAAKAAAVRNSRVRRASAVAGALLAVGAVWALTGTPGLSLVSGDPAAGGAAATPGEDREVQLAALAERLSAAQPSPRGFTRSTPVLGLGAQGFAPICGGPAASDRQVLVAVTSTLTGSRAGGTVTIVQSAAVYRPGGVAALLAEAAAADCVDDGDLPPGYPPGSVLLHGRGSNPTAYLVAPTSASTALFLRVGSAVEAALADTLVSVLPGLVADAGAGADEVVAGIPR